MLSYLGINKIIKAEWRHPLPSTSRGVGVHKLLVEVVIGQINLLSNITRHHFPLD